MSEAETTTATTTLLAAEPNATETQTSTENKDVQVEVKGPEASVQTTEAKPNTEEKPAEVKSVVPEKYDLKLPKDSLLDASQVEKIAAFAKEQGFSNEMAQSILERENSAVMSFAESQKQQAKQMSEAWISQVKSDKELGGEAFNKNVEMAKRVAAKFGTEDFIKALNTTGLGDHPELVRVFARIGKAMSEDQLVLPGAAPAAPKSIEERLYGSKTI